MTQSAENRTVIDELLAEQQSLTVVSRFAQKHEQELLPLQSRYYRDLLPLSKPGPGEQYAFEVDLDRCSGCKACVAACHSLNGLEPAESWRSVGLLISGADSPAVQQTVTTGCHHCVEPGCLDGCPVLAYEKDSSTGIVHHLDDQCMGCGYCVMKCPYEVPQYSKRLGIVRKCDMCSTRLESGEAPACVQSCPNEAIKISVVSQAQVRTSVTTNAASFLPDSPSPIYTIPTTRYVSARGLPETLQAADREQTEPATPHWPLVFMLVLTQVAAGGYVAGALAEFRGGEVSRPVFWFSASCLLAGLLASVFHLGRPLKSWRAFLGVQRSWLSREILSFNAFALSALFHLAAEVLPSFSFARQPLLAAAAAAGLLSVFCSVMVYHDTPREFWAWRHSAPKFFGTTSLAFLAVTAWTGSTVGIPGALLLLVIVCAARFVHEAAIFRALADTGMTPLKRTATLMAGPLRKTTVFRYVTLFVFGIATPMTFHALGANSLPLWVGFFLLLGELAERSLFFRAVSQPKMPGGLP